MPTTTASWQTQQKNTALNKKITKPDIPGDYGGHPIPPMPTNEPFTDGHVIDSWSLVFGATTLLFLTIICVNGLNKR